MYFKRTKQKPNQEFLQQNCNFSGGFFFFSLEAEVSGISQNLARIITPDWCVRNSYLQNSSNVRAET